MFNDKYFKDKYIEGKPILSDESYEKIFPNSNSSFIVKKGELKFNNTSINKIYIEKQLLTWKKKRTNIKNFSIYPKYDGINIFYDIKEDKFYTKNNGLFGIELSNSKFYYIKKELGEEIKDYDYLRFELLSLNGRQEVNGKISKKDNTPIDNVILKIHCIVKDDLIFNLNNLKKFNTDFIDISYQELNFENLNNIIDIYRKKSSIPIDGLVIIPDFNFDLNIDNDKKYSSHLIAFKKNYYEGESIITGCQWKMKSKLSVVLEFKEVLINGKKFTKLSTTEDMIIKNKIGKDSKIIIELAGDIIPKIKLVEPSNNPFIKENIISDIFEQTQSNLLRHYEINKKKTWFKKYANAKSILDIKKQDLLDFLEIDEFNLTRWEILQIFNLIIGIKKISSNILNEINSNDFDIEKIKSLDGIPKGKSKDKLIEQLNNYKLNYMDLYENYFC